MKTSSTQFVHYVYDVRGRKIDTIFAVFDNPEEMRRSLIEHDGYPSNITVICNDAKASENNK